MTQTDAAECFADWGQNAAARSRPPNRSHQIRVCFRKDDGAGAVYSDIEGHGRLGPAGQLGKGPRHGRRFVRRRALAGAPGVASEMVQGQSCGHGAPNARTDCGEMLLSAVSTAAIQRPELQASLPKSVFSMWSLARSAWAAMVRAGLTAAEDGMNEASITNRFR